MTADADPTVPRRLYFAEKTRWNIPLAQLLRECDLPRADVVMVGDGSGTGGWTMGAGWACVISIPILRRREVIYGGWSCGSILMAELSAYFQGLLTVEARFGKELRALLQRPYRVVVLTDSQVLVGQHTSLNSPSADMLGVWTGLKAVAQHHAIDLRFHFLPRLSTQLNAVADQIAGKVRKALAEPALSEYRIRQDVQDLDLMNPM